ncbi:U8 snoRNA-decapping enzyme [Sander lucioperca]|uniref:U8 snoRNA-decapping enzyme n=1 Tax=Sander lucioperca TaxID=283035 RepID=A0A8C9ZS98_SANLU|nr:U8 snoRNA-decapping enzyme [Sander lucioperca]XP_031142766.1 U8 snoRNA-decapping enzyme [Sander lucioperca]XP_031142767.1 U8 snoRNA-decapping enzyme [Sander lucioperca]XP_031142768.1 U8 snoRNA-decapping enzyme [Sander lucioperca]
MASGQLSRAEALACSGCRHACHVMLYCDTKSQLFGRLPIRHIILMQMRFDGLLGFPGGFVKPSEETLEAGLSRELLEELGVALPILVEDHADSCYAPASSHSSSSSSSSRLITHFYVKKMEEEQIREVERAAASTATDHGQEVLGMVRVPLYTTKGGGGLAAFLSHSFIGNARSQLADSLLRLNLVAPEELHKALTHSLKIHTQTAEDLQVAFALTEAKRKRF